MVFADGPQQRPRDAKNAIVVMGADAENGFGHDRLLLGRENYEALDAQIDSKQAPFASFGADATGDKELIHFGTAEGDVAGRDVAAVVLADQLTVWVEHL